MTESKDKKPEDEIPEDVKLINEQLLEERKVYDRNYVVDGKYLREYKVGNFEGTSVRPQWIIQALTETFGLCGTGWYYDVVDKWIERHGASEARAFVEINLYYLIRNPVGLHAGVWSKPVHGIGGNVFATRERGTYFASDECFKMAETDALSKASQKLGIAGSIYMGNEDTKYTEGNKGATTKSKKKVDESIPHDFRNEPPSIIKGKGSDKESAPIDENMSREDAIDIISEEYIKPGFRKALKEFVKTNGVTSHDQLEDSKLIEFIISQRV